jgi:hypothetical protein
MARLSADTIDPVGGFLPQVVEGQREREELAEKLRPFLSVGKIDRDALREALQRVQIKQLMDSLERNSPYDVRENMKVLAELAGLKATKISVEVPRGHTQAELDAFREAGKAGVVAQIPEVT